MILFEKGIEVDDTLVESVGGQQALESTVLSYIKALLKGSYVRQEEKKAREQAEILLAEKVKKYQEAIDILPAPEEPSKNPKDEDKLK
jgi:hypothetical protein